MKRIPIFLTLLILLSSTLSYADGPDSCIIEPLDKGYYYETVIEELPDISYAPRSISHPDAVASTKTGSKTTYCKNSSGTVMWYVKVTGVFTYGNGTATCTSSTVTAKSLSTSWKITSKSASKTGNKANATATAKEYLNGVPVGSLTRTVMLTCSSNGTLS